MGTVTLRQAIQAFETHTSVNGSTAGTGNDTIQFAANLSGGTITLQNGQLELSGSGQTVTIDGGTAGITVDGNFTSSNFGSLVFLVDSGVTAVLNGLTITHGDAGFGGGIDNHGTLTVSNSTFTANTATYGGGILNDHALTVSNSTFTANSADRGGGIYNGFGGTLTVSNSTFSANTASGAGDGGGIFNDQALTVSSSTFTGNSANLGGGIFNYGTLTGTQTVSNSTFSANTASGSDGGGIWNGVTLTVNNCTLSGNSAGSGSGGDGGGIFNGHALTVSSSTFTGNTAASGSGGGIFSGLYNTVSLTVSNSTFTANSASSGGGGIENDGTLTITNTIVGGDTGGDISNLGSVNTSSFNNLIGSFSNSGSGGLTNGVNNNQVGVANLGLAPLGNYGGPTKTMALLPGSPAIGKGDPSQLNGVTTDQRGLPRTVNSSLDIGAFQSQPLVVAATAGNYQTAIAGQPFVMPLTVQVYTSDLSTLVKNLPVTFTVVPTATGAGLQGAPQTVNTDNNGQATLTATANTIAGSYAVNAAVPSALSGVSVNFSLANLAGAPANLSALFGNGQSTTVGTNFPTLLEVQASDIYGNLVPGAQVTFIEHDGAGVPGAGATFPSNATTVAVATNAQGLAIAPVLTANHTAGSFTVTTSAGAVSGPTFSLNNTPGAAAAIAAVSGTPQVAPVGFAYPNLLQAKVSDSYGNPVPNVPVTFSAPASGASGTFNGPPTVTTNALGVATAPAFTANQVAGSFTVTVSAPPPVGSASFSLTNYPIANKFHVAGITSPVTAGTAATITVTAQDASGNTVKGYRGTIVFTSSDPLADLPAPYSFSAADQGMAQFSITLEKAGTRSVTVTDTLLSGSTGSETGIAVKPAAASTLTVSGFPSSPTAGVQGTVTVTARDAYGNVATGYLGTVQLTSSDPQAVLPVNHTFIATDNGVHSFNVTLKTAGAQAIIATDTVAAAINGAQSDIVVKPGVAHKLVVISLPASTTAGTVLSFCVKAEDAFGNTATGYHDKVQFTSNDPQAKVQFTSNDPQASLPASYTFTTGAGTGYDNGVHTFTVTLKTAGPRQLTIADITTGSGVGPVQAYITVQAAAATHFVLIAPSSQKAGLAFNLTVEVMDAYGNVATGYTGTVHLSSSGAAATGLPADYTFTAADNGIHTFTGLVLNTTGPQWIKVEDKSDSSLTATWDINVL
jgi:hypothetical protein